jgi:uncharacterized protein YpmB
MSRNVLIAIVVIVLIIIVGMALTVKRSVKTGAAREEAAMAPARK